MEQLIVDICRATLQSAAEISQLLEANAIARGGELHGNWSEQIIRAWLDDGMQAFVARIGGRIKGVLLTSEPHYLRSVPAIRMLEQVDRISNDYVYGPVCVASDARKAGLLVKLWKGAQSHYGDRRALLFVNKNNAASLAAHARLGVVQIGTFEAAGGEYFIFASTPACSP